MSSTATLEVADPDLRWQQRLANFRRALQQLQAAVDLQAQRPLSELEQQGLIQAFECTHELAWNVMKDYFVFQGRSDLTGSRDATRAAFAVQLIADGEGWMEMIASRNQSSHTFDCDVAQAIAQKVTQRYFGLFSAFSRRMQALIDADGTPL